MFNCLTLLKTQDSREKDLSQDLKYPQHASCRMHRPQEPVHCIRQPHDLSAGAVWCRGSDFETMGAEAVLYAFAEFLSAALEWGFCVLHRRHHKT